MSVNIGPKIGIDGEKEYRAEIQAIIQQGKTLAAQMGSVSTSFSNATNKEEALKKVSNTLTDQVKNQKDVVEKLRDAVQKSTEKTGENSTTTQKWQEQLYKAEKELNQLEGQTAESIVGIDKLGKETKETGNDTEKAGKQFDMTSKDVNEYGGETEKATKKTRIFGDVLKASLLSDAIKSGIKFLADSAKKTVKYLSDAAQGAAAYGDEVNTLAAKTGISTNALQEYKYMAGLLDVELNTVAGAHAKLTKNMDAAQKGTGSAYETFEKLGVSVKDASGRLRSADDVFNDTIDALGKIDNDAERDAAAMTIFGKSAQELNPLIKAGADKLNAFRKEAHDVGAVLDTETLNTLNDAQDNFDRLSKAGEALKNKLGAKIFSQFNSELAEATAIMQDFASGKASPEQIESRLDKLFTNLLQKIEQTGGKAGPYVEKAFSKIIGFAGKHFPKIADKLLSQLPNITNKIGSGVEKFIPKIAEGIGKTLGSLLRNLPSIISAGFNLGESLLKGISNGIKSLGSGLKEGIQKPFGEAVEELRIKTNDLKNEIAALPEEFDGVRESIANVDAKQKEAEHWLEIYEELHKKTNLSKEEQNKLREAVEQLVKKFPELGEMIDIDAGKWDLDTEAIKRSIEAISDRARAQAYFDAASEALEKQVRYEQEYAQATEGAKQAQDELNASIEFGKALAPALDEIEQAHTDIASAGRDENTVIKNLSDSTKNLLRQMGIEVKTSVDVYNALNDLETAQQNNIDKQNDLKETIGLYDEAAKNAEKGIKACADQVEWFFKRGEQWETEAYKAGANTVNGVTRGIRAQQREAVQAAHDTMNLVLRAFKSTAEIKSPSKITTKFGEMLTIGLPLGMKNKKPEAVREAHDVMQDVISSMRDAETFETSLRVNARRADNVAAIIGALHTNGTVTNNSTRNTNLGGVSINVYAAQGQDVHAIAREVINEMTNTFNAKKAVFA